MAAAMLSPGLDPDRAVAGALHASRAALAEGDAAAALLEATRAENGLKEAQQLQGAHSTKELALAVTVQLAAAYSAADRQTEALQAYHRALKVGQQAVQVRINIGNILLKQGSHAAAAREFRIALDQLPTSARKLRAKVASNLGVALLQQGLHQEAITALEGSLELAPDAQAAFNLTICASALGDTEHACACFARLVQACAAAPTAASVSAPATATDPSAMLDAALLPDRHKLEQYLVTASELLAPLADVTGDAAAGYSWCCQAVEQAGFLHAAALLAEARPSVLLHWDQHAAAVQSAKEAAVAPEQAKPFAILRNMQSQADAGSSAELPADAEHVSDKINKGCKLAQSGKMQQAQNLFGQALQSDPDSHEALYNSGLVHMQQGNFEKAQSIFERLHQLQPKSPDCMIQVAQAMERQGRLQQAADWMERLCMLVPGDAAALAMLGSLHARLGSDSDAFRCYSEAHEIVHNDEDVMVWLASYCLKQQKYRQAEEHYRQLERMNAAEPRWPVMVAACLHTQGLNAQALTQYRKALAAHPFDAECLRQIITLCREQGLAQEAQGYADRLSKAEQLPLKSQEQPLQLLPSHRSMSSSKPSPPRLTSASPVKTPSFSRPATANALAKKGLQLPGMRALVPQRSEAGAGLSAVKQVHQERQRDQWSNGPMDLLP